MSVIPTVYNQGTGLIGSTTSGAAIPSNIDDLIVNDTLLVGGEATFNGAVTVNNTLTVSGGISFQDVTVQGTFILEGKTPTQLAFYTTGGELTGTADMTYSNGVTTLSNVTVVNDLLFGALQKTDGNYYDIALFDTNRVCVSGSPNTLRFQPNSGTINCRNGTITSDFTVGNNLEVTDGSLTVVAGEIDAENGGISCEEDITVRSGDIYLNNGNLYMTSGTLSANDATITNDLTVTTGTLTVPDLTVTNSASITGLVLNLTATNAQREFDVVLKDRDTPFSFSKELDSTHLTYNPFYSRLTVFEVKLRALEIEQTNNGTNPAEVNVNSLGFYVDQADGHRFQTNSVDKLWVRPGRVDIYPDLYLSNDLNLSADLNAINVNLTAPTYSVDTNCRVLFLDSNSNTGKISTNNQIFFNPNNETLRTTNCTVATALKLQNIGVPGTAGFTFPFLLRNQGTYDVKQTSTSGSNKLYCDPATGDLVVGGTITVTGAIVNNLIPLNYTTVFSTRHSGSGTYGGVAWTMFNVTGAAGEDTAYNGSATGRLFGRQNQIMWPYTSAAGGAPTISQYGRDSTGTSYIDFGFGASSDSGDKFRLLSSQYEGWWYCEVNVFYQNTSGSQRDMPYIRLMKQVNGSGAYIEQPQVSQASEYLRYDSGEVSNLKLAGPIYFNNNTGTNFRIYTLLEQGNIGSNPPPWNNESTNYLGLGLNISLRFLGKSAVGEQVTTL